MNGGVFRDRAQLIEMVQSGSWEPLLAIFSTDAGKSLRLFSMHMNQTNGTTEQC